MFSLVFSTTGKRGFQTSKVAVADVYYVCFRAVITGITGGTEFYRLPLEKENTDSLSSVERNFLLLYFAQRLVGKTSAF